MFKIQELVRLHRMGKGAREVARMLRVSPNTERAYRVALVELRLLEGSPDELPAEAELQALMAQVLPRAVPQQQQSTIDRWRERIEEMLERGAQPKAIFDRLRLEESEFIGSYDAVKRLCLRVEKKRGVRAEDVAIPVSTAPGQVAQVDFGYVGLVYDPQREKHRPAWVFVMVLGYSREMYARVVFDQKTRTWIALHVAAFQHFGGAPAELVPDRLKAAVVRSAFGLSENMMLNQSYVELARHYGCIIDPTPARSPKKKGKVESGVKYVKKNFAKPRDLKNMTIDECNCELMRWIEEIAGQRLHGTTGRMPREVFETEERAALKPLPLLPFASVEWKQAKVHPDAHIYFDKRFYSVPWKLIGEEVFVQATADTVAIYAQNERIATHDRRGETAYSTNNSHMPEHRVDYRNRSREYWEGRAANMGDEVLIYVREVFEADDVKSNLRTVQAIVTLLAKYPTERARGACRRASHFGTHSYRGLKEILFKALDLEPIPNSLFTDEECSKAARFARRPSYFQEMAMEQESGNRR